MNTKNFDDQVFLQYDDKSDLRGRQLTSIQEIHFFFPYFKKFFTRRT